MISSSSSPRHGIMLALLSLILSNLSIQPGTLLVEATIGDEHYEPLPKMIGEAVSRGKPFPPKNHNDNEDDHGATSSSTTTTVHSSSATFIGTCSKSSPFEFFLGGGSGRGVIGTTSQRKQATRHHHHHHHHQRLLKRNKAEGPKSLVTQITFSNFVELESGEIKLENEGKAEPNFFAIEGLTDDEMEHYVGVPFSYRDVVTGAGGGDSTGASVKVYCSQEPTSEIIVLLANDGKEDVKASLTVMNNGAGQLLELDESVESKAVLKGESIDTEDVSNDSPPSMSDNRHIVLLNENKPRSLSTSTTTSSEKKNPKYSLVQALILSDSGDTVPRTLFVENKGMSPPTSVPIKVEDSEVTDNGDVAITFNIADFLQQSEHIKIVARIGIVDECIESNIEVVDMTAMLSTQNPTMFVHGGWFRKAIKDNKITCKDWEPIVMNASATDPNNNYEQVAYMDKVSKTDLMKRRNLQRSNDSAGRRRLREEPSNEELEINTEMTQGRRPSSHHLLKEGGSLRSLSSGVHKKILVHGYCATSNPFTTSHFSNAIEFKDPNNYSSGGANWSNEEFALKIATFAQNEGISGCGIIGHSQGGLAALHLYTNYWSCLDYANQGGSALIQSVGSPYQGSILSGTLAAIGDVFGIQCGTNNDITESGAIQWLYGIPYWARSKVNFYTTSFTDKWWSWDYCNLGSEILLGDPEDGAVEKGRGYLPGGVDKGHKTGQCHTGGMRDPPQTEDYNRNREMNSNAKY